MALVVLTGGARSGKSSAAENLARQRHAQGATVTVAVFGHSGDGADAEYAQRIERHQADRPEGFATREYAGGMDWLAADAEGLLVVDCLGTLLGRIMEEEWLVTETGAALVDAPAEALPEGFDAVCAARLDEVVAAIAARSGDTIVVTNEVGAGIVPAFASGRLFSDLLGRANRRLIDCADAAYLVVAGRLFDLSALPRAAHWPED
jgi:adenosylcobinamide kinase / adenosylcobinamide-phosphate guanylyltransferase